MWRKSRALLVLLALTWVTPRVAHAQMADSYRSAASSYRTRAASANGEWKSYYLGMSRYYECLARSLAGGGSCGAEPREPTTPEAAEAPAAPAPGSVSSGNSKQDPIADALRAGYEAYKAAAERRKREAEAEAARRNEQINAEADVAENERIRRRRQLYNSQQSSKKEIKMDRVNAGPAYDDDDIQSVMTMLDKRKDDFPELDYVIPARIGDPSKLPKVPNTLECQRDSYVWAAILYAVGAEANARAAQWVVRAGEPDNRAAYQKTADAHAAEAKRNLKMVEALKGRVIPMEEGRKCSTQDFWP